MLSSGDIFLNVSVSEAFCMAILEAVSCGLYVLSTRVGGIHEILPSHMMSLAPPLPEALIKSLTNIIINKKYLHKEDYNQYIRKNYNWHKIAQKTSQVYEKIPENDSTITFLKLKKFLFRNLNYHLFVVALCILKLYLKMF